MIFIMLNLINMIRRTYWRKKVRSVLAKYKRGTHKILQKHEETLKEFANNGYSQDYDERIEFLKSKGFVPDESNSFFIHKKDGVVLKNSGMREYMPSFAVPTIEYGDGFYLQPVVNTSTARRALTLIEEHFDDEADDIDLHSGNVGMWKGIPVAFDW